MRGRLIERVFRLLVMATVMVAICAEPALAATHWRKIASTGAGTYGIDFVTSKKGFAVSEAGLMRTTNGGKTWTKRSLPEANLEAEFFDAKVGIAYGTNIYRTTDGGKSFKISKFPGSASAGGQTSVTDVVFVTKKTLVATADTGTGGAILRSTNGGKTWSVAKKTAKWMRAVDFGSSKNGVACGGIGSKFVYTTNGGKTWKTSKTKNPSSSSEVVFLDAKTAVAVGWWRNIMRTTNGGRTWEKAKVKLPAPSADDPEISFESVSFPTPKRGWAVANRGTVVKTTDGGKTWVKQASGTKADLTGVSFTSATQGWISAENGRIMKYRK